MKRPVIFMYSGQGAQFYHMGRELYDHDPVFTKWMKKCSDIVEPLISRCLVDLIYPKDNSNRFAVFERTLYTHPANVVFAYCLTHALYHRGIRPDALLGYSLGEYTAALVSGALQLEDGLKKVVRQAQLLEEQTPTAGMIAILDDPNLMRREPELFAGTWLACHNFAEHFVVTGYRSDLERIDQTLKQRGLTSQILPISHGFHSPLVDPIEDACVEAFNTFGSIGIPTYSARLTTLTPDLNGQHIWEVLRHSVRFMETVRQIEMSGPHVYIDVGPAGTLSTFTKYILAPDSRSEALGTVNQFGRDLTSIQKIVDLLGM